MSRWPRAYRLQQEHHDRENVKRATEHQDDIPEGSAGRLRGIPAIGRGCPGHIRDTDPLGRLLRDRR